MNSAPPSQPSPSTGRVTRSRARDQNIVVPPIADSVNTLDELVNAGRQLKQEERRRRQQEAEADRQRIEHERLRREEAERLRREEAERQLQLHQQEQQDRLRREEAERRRGQQEAERQRIEQEAEAERQRIEQENERLCREEMDRLRREQEAEAERQRIERRQQEAERQSHEEQLLHIRRHQQQLPSSSRRLFVPEEKQRDPHPTTTTTRDPFTTPPRGQDLSKRQRTLAAPKKKDKHHVRDAMSRLVHALDTEEPTIPYKDMVDRLTQDLHKESTCQAFLALVLEVMKDMDNQDVLPRFKEVITTSTTARSTTDRSLLDWIVTFGLYYHYLVFVMGGSTALPATPRFGTTVCMWVKRAFQLLNDDDDHHRHHHQASA